MRQKQCKYCAKELDRREKESDKQWLRREYCGNLCRLKYQKEVYNARFFGGQSILESGL